MAQICKYKTEYRDTDGVNAKLWIAATVDASGAPIANPIWFPADAPAAADLTAMEIALGLTAGDLTDSASLLTAIATDCGASAVDPVDIEIMEDPDGNPYSVVFGPTGEIVSVVNLTSGATEDDPVAIAALGLQEIQNREVIKNPPRRWCVDGVQYLSTLLEIFADDQADGTPLFAETLWTLENDPTAAVVPDPTPAATDVTAGQCALAHRSPVDLCCCDC